MASRDAGMMSLQVRRPAGVPRLVRGITTRTFEGKERLVHALDAVLRCVLRPTDCACFSATSGLWR